MTAPERRVPRPNIDRTLSPEDRRILDVWLEHGVPCDLSTLESAAGLAMVCWERVLMLEDLVDVLADQSGRRWAAR